MVKDYVTVWDDCLKTIREHLGEQSFNTWFQPIRPLSLREHTLTIQVPSQFFYEWLEEHYVELLRQVLLAELGPHGRLEYSIIVDKGNEQHQPYTVNIPTSPGSKNKPVANGQPIVQANRLYESPYMSDTFINPNYTFDSYVEGECNRLARSAGMAVAAKPGTTAFNPLVIYGGVGLGKTHLVQAIGNKIKDNHAQKFILYVASEKFTNQFIEAVKNNSIQDFTHFYLNVDVLILDDVQFLAKKERTQEIFFHIFNHLQQNSRQIIMTSDCPPRDLQGMQERLLSRFKWGLTADLQQPDFETRMAIIEKKLQSDGIDVPPDVVEFLARNVDTNIRELEGVLISLVAQSSLNKKAFDLNLAKHILKHLVQHIEKELDTGTIKQQVAEFFDVSVAALSEKSRKKEIVIARQVSMFLIKEYTDLSLKMIGQQFGGRDHSTVIHALQSVKNMLDTDKKFRQQFEELREQVSGRKASDR